MKTLKRFTTYVSRSAVHNSQSSKSQVDQREFAAGRGICFVLL